MGSLFGLGKKKEEVDDLPPEPKPTRPFTVSFGRGPSSYEPKGVGAYGLTPLGRKAVKDMDANDIDFQIMASAEENGALTLGKLSENTHLSLPKIQQRVLGRYGLVAGGFMKKVSASGE
ncbi:MAG: hypothetical protein WC516_08780 [Patescibacteria group bacterium]|jgi:hypothetical protein